MSPDYTAAEPLLFHHLRELPLAGRVVPHWSGDGTFTFSEPTRLGPRSWRVDPEAVTKEAYEALADPRGDRDPLASISPDGRWALTAVDHNVWLTDRDSGETRRLTHNGAPDHSWGTPPGMSSHRVVLAINGRTHPAVASWSPDSRRVLVHRLDERRVGRNHLVSAAPVGGGRPEAMSWPVPIPGEAELPTCELVVVEATTGAITPVAQDPYVFMYDTPLHYETWWVDPTTVLAIVKERGDQRGEVRRIDALTGAVEVLLTETSDTWVSFSDAFGETPIVRPLATGEVLLWAEASGWGHLWLVSTDGTRRPVTAGDWIVRSMVQVDEEARTAIFLAGGREPGSDPYARQVYSVGLDDGIVTRLSDDHLDHEVFVSPDGRWIVDNASYLDAPARAVLRCSDFSEVLELSACDVTVLDEVGWRPWERFCVKDADGVEDLWGAILTPAGFDPSQRYPVLEEIYAVAQMTVGPVASPGGPGWIPVLRSPALAQLGFVCVVVDGRGTPSRSKAFATGGYHRPDGQPLEDHPAVIRQLAATRPWMDLDRVGLHGHSGGGYTSTKLLLTDGDLYRAAVSTGGSHDELVYLSGWSDRYIGVGADQTGRRSHGLVEQLTGKLMLLHGEMDDNVSPQQTLRLYDAFLRAHKDVELVIVPGSDHMLNTHIAYVHRRILDFLVRHVMGVEPPEHRFAEIAPHLGGLAGLFG